MKLCEVVIEPNYRIIAELSLVFKKFNRYDEEYVLDFSKRILEADDFDPFSHLLATDKINPEEDCVLSISKPNSKLKGIAAPSFSLPAGYTCQFAKVCKSIANKHGKEFSDGKKIKDQGDIRCYAASSEAQYPNVRQNRWTNFDLLRKHSSSGEMADLILRSIKAYEHDNGTLKIFRIHDSGDFFSQAYFDAWVSVANTRSDVLFYAYTKALPFWKNRKDDIPKNLRLTASEGGTKDEMISKEKFRKAIIVKDQGEAIERKLNIDVNDFLAAFGEGDFALLLHGNQPAASGNTSTARKNSQVIKTVAKKLSADPADVDKLIRQYTS
jgi:hypothetical protein